MFHIKPVSTFRFRRNKRCLPQNALNAFCSKKNVVGYVEVFMRQILAHNDERGHIMTFVTQKLLYLHLIKRFNLKNVLNFSNTWAWPVVNVFVAHSRRGGSSR